METGITDKRDSNHRDGSAFRENEGVREKARDWGRGRSEGEVGQRREKQSRRERSFIFTIAPLIKSTLLFPREKKNIVTFP